MCSTEPHVLSLDLLIRINVCKLKKNAIHLCMPHSAYMNEEMNVEDMNWNEEARCGFLALIFKMVHH